MGIALRLLVLVALIVSSSRGEESDFQLASGDDLLTNYTNSTEPIVTRECSSLVDCPDECSCINNGTIIDCSARHLISVPQKLRECVWNQVRLLNLSVNRIVRIESGAFVNLPNLDRLFLYNNEISDIDSDGFIGLRSLTLLSLDDNNLTALPHGVFRELTSLGVLLLYSNRISLLPPNVFQNLSNLAVLSLHDNQLSHFNRQHFSGLSNLQRLYSQDNKISDLSNSPFFNLSKLVLLYLSGNQLTQLTNTSLVGLNRLHTLVIRSNAINSISNGAFSHSPNLRYLYMDNNQITHLTKAMLSPFTGLYGLTLAGNRIATIKDETFVRQHYIQTLYLHNNIIQNLTERTFHGLYNLREMVLYQNRITSLPPNMLINSGYLQRLWLQNNRIQCMNERAFTGLGSLQLLHLAENEINYLPRNVFQSTSSLTYLILSSNNLTRIETHPFRNLKNLVQLALFYNSINYIAEGAFDGSVKLTYIQWNQVLDFTRDNKLSCDCDAFWLRDFIFTQRPYYASIICASPSNVRGQIITRVSFSNCSKDMKLSMSPLPLMSFVSEGSCVELKCTPSRLMDVSWNKIIKGYVRPVLTDGSTTIGSTCSNSIIDTCGNTDTTGLLTIPHFTLNDEGIYTCSVTSDENNNTITEMRHIHIGVPPSIIKSPQSLRFRDPPTFVMFEVTTSGTPPPTIQWYHNSVLINITNTTRMHLTSTGSLVILDTVLEDSGVYTVIADNGAGSVQATATLTISFRSGCYRGQGCQNGGSCLPYYYCVCPQGYGGEGCEVSPQTVGVSPASTVTPQSTPEPVQYSGDYYSGDYYSGDGYYYSGDYEYRKKRDVQHVLYDYDVIDTTSPDFHQEVKVQRGRHHKKVKKGQRPLIKKKTYKNSRPIELLDVSKLRNQKELPLAIDVNGLPNDNIPLLH